MDNDRPVRWGVLGAARVFERRMVPAFRDAAGNELIAVASRSEAKARETAARHGIARAYGAYEALLDDPDVDAVYIPLPNDLHRTWTIRALEAGKHVLCDKPAALSYADAVAMTEAARLAGRRLQEGFMYRHHPQHDRLQAIMASGEIGTPVEIRSVFTYLANRADRENIRWNPTKGGGAFLDVGVYALNAARFYFQAEPLAVTATAVIDPDSGVDLHTTALLEFPDGRTATITGGFDQGFCARLEIAGSTGIAVADRALNIGERGVTLRFGENPEQVESFPHIDHWTAEVVHFAACVRDPSRPLWPGEDGVLQARAVEAVLRSVAEKRRVMIEEINAVPV